MNTLYSEETGKMVTLLQLKCHVLMQVTCPQVTADGKLEYHNNYIGV